MWPELLDMTREESKRILRRVELEAYSSVVSAFRAQGDLSKEKKRILHDLQQILSISTERHRAEVRRAVNDEKLATIADNMSPSNSTQEWLIEGRRLVPLMPRLVPQTAFTVTANQVANIQAEKNASLPSPSQTGIREAVPTPTSPTPTPKTSRPSSPTSNVVVLPSGMSIHIKGGLNTDDEDDIQIRKRRRSTSTESLVSPTGTPVPQVTYTTTIANVPNVSPKKITISKSPQAPTRVVASGSQTQKVILVSSQGQSPSQPSGSQKTISMPIVRSTVSTGTSTTLPNKSIIFPPNSASTITTSSHMISVATTSTASVASGGTSTTAFLTPTISVSRPRFKTIPRQKILQLPSQSPRPGVVIPMGPQPVQPSPQSFQGTKPGSKQTPTIQIRQEGGMKIITQNVQAGTSKILPKPSQMSTSTGTPVVVVSAGTSTTSSAVTMVTRPGITGTPAGTKVLNIQTQGGKIITAPRGSSVVTVNPKTLHLTAVKNASGITGAKPNVIVVQKTQPRRSTGVAAQTGTPGKSTTAVISGPFEKELVSFLQKQDPTKQYVVTTTTANLSRTSEPQRKVIVTTSAHGDIAKQLQKAKCTGETSTQVPSNILQDLIQAAGIVPDGNQDNQSGEVTINIDEAQLAALTSVSQAVTASKVTTTTMPNNEWFEYDVTDEQGNTYTHTAESADTAAAIQSLLDMQANGGGQKPKVTVQRSSNVDIGHLSDQLNSQQFYTIEQAMTILNQDKEPTATSYIQTDSQSQTTIDTSDGDPHEILTAVPYHPPSTSSISSSINTTSASIAATTLVSSEPTQAGDLDPQTGMFYVDKNNMNTLAQVTTKVVPSASISKQDVVVVQQRDQGDLLSSSLAQAQIDLDPYQFFEEGQGVNKSPEDAGIAVDQTKIEVPAAVQVQSVVPTEQVVVQKMVVAAPVTTTASAIRIQPSSFIPLQDVSKAAAPGKPSTINITTKQPVAGVSLAPRTTVVPVPVSSIHVTVEPSGLDTSHMKMEDFTSQQFTDKTEFVGIDHMEEIGTAESPPSVAGSSSLSDSQGEGSLSLEPSQLKRKRKLLSGDTDSQGSPPAGSGGSGAGGWLRAALGVLNKVSRYRGANRDKNELNAATWFTQPVDPSDAPDYYTIVENPMDFGTIKKKLETGKYGEFDEFHNDMMLVRDNCYLYNPEQSLVRQDCEEVFTFYSQEHEKLLDKWQKTHIASPISKKQRLDRSPIRP